MVDGKSQREEMYSEDHKINVQKESEIFSEFPLQHGGGKPSNGHATTFWNLYGFNDGPNTLKRAAWPWITKRTPIPPLSLDRGNLISASVNRPEGMFIPNFHWSKSHSQTRHVFLFLRLLGRRVFETGIRIWPHQNRSSSKYIATSGGPHDPASWARNSFRSSANWSKKEQIVDIVLCGLLCGFAVFKSWLLFNLHLVKRRKEA